MQRANAWWEWVSDRLHSSAAPSALAIVICVLATVALCITPPTWRHTRHVATVVHEMGHVFTAWLFGRKIAGIKLHSDTSGLTISQGKPRGIGVLATFLSGYPAPSLAGTAMIWAVFTGWSGVGLTLLVVLLFWAFWLTSNAFGFLVVIPALAVTCYVWAHNDPTTSATFVLAVGMFLVIAGLRCVGDLWRLHQAPDQDSSTTDAAMAAQHSLFPATLWTVLFGTVGIACVVQSALLTVAAL